MSYDVKLIGMDVHKEAIVIAVLNESGKLVMESVIETKASSILQFIHGLRGELHVTWEEGTWAAWLYDRLQPQVPHIVVCNPRRNALLKEGSKSDKVDARKLADRLRTGMLRPVYHGENGLRTLRELGRSYQTLSKDLMRVMNRRKALYRGWGIACAGTQVYAARAREEWLSKIAQAGVRRRAELLYHKLAEAALANVSRKLIEAQEQERTRIGRELHDDIGQRLAMLAIELQQLHEDPPNVPEVRSRIGGFHKQTLEIAADVQSLSHELHSAKLQYLGIAAAIRGFCKEFGEQQKVEIEFQTHDLPSPVSPDTALCFFRVLQEALHNSAKHSGVRHFEVRLWGTSDEIHLMVRDSGVGFDREAANKSRGLGLISMEERLKLVNGTLSIESQPKRGTTIHASVPFSSKSDSVRAAG